MTNQLNQIHRVCNESDSEVAISLHAYDRTSYITNSFQFIPPAFKQNQQEKDVQQQKQTDDFFPKCDYCVYFHKGYNPEQIQDNLFRIHRESEIIEELIFNIYQDVLKDRDEPFIIKIANANQQIQEQKKLKLLQNQDQGRLEEHKIFENQRNLEEQRSFIEEKTKQDLEDKNKTMVYLDTPYYIKNNQGFYLFISEDLNGQPPDIVVEAKDKCEQRSVFYLKKEQQDKIEHFSIYSKEKDVYLFVSGDKLGQPPDNVVEARHQISDGRQFFLFHEGYKYLYNIHYGMYLFVSGDKMGNPPDNVVEAKVTKDDRGVFEFIPVLQQNDVQQEQKKLQPSSPVDFVGVNEYHQSFDNYISSCLFQWRWLKCDNGQTYKVVTVESGESVSTEQKSPFLRIHNLKIKNPADFNQGLSQKTGFCWRRHNRDTDNKELRVITLEDGNEDIKDNYKSPVVLGPENLRAFEDYYKDLSPYFNWRWLTTSVANHQFKVLTIED